MSDFKVIVEKALGDSRFSVKTMEGQQMICHIPGKFRGPRKHRNFVKAGQIILVQTRNDNVCDFISIVSQSSTQDFRPEPDIQLASTAAAEIPAQIIPDDEDIDVDGI